MCLSMAIYLESISRFGVLSQDKNIYIPIDSNNIYSRQHQIINILKTNTMKISKEWNDKQEAVKCIIYI